MIILVAIAIFMIALSFLTVKLKDLPLVGMMIGCTLLVICMICFRIN